MPISELAPMYAIVDRARRLGERALPNGTELIGHVPHVAPDAWLHTMFAGLTEDEVAKVESEAGRSLTAEHRRILAAHNGLMLFSTALSLYGLRHSNVRVGDAARQPFGIRVPNGPERVPGAPKTWVYVGGYSSDGSQLCVDFTTSHVYRCARYSAKPLKEWPNLISMLNEEATRISSLFDENGRRLRL